MPDKYIGQNAVATVWVRSANGKHGVVTKPRGPLFGNPGHLPRTYATKASAERAARRLVTK